MGHTWIIIVVILLIVLIVFGPGKLGQLGGALGKSLNEFRNSGKQEQTDSPAEPGPEKKS